MKRIAFAIVLGLAAVVAFAQPSSAETGVVSVSKITYAPNGNKQAWVTFSNPEATDAYVQTSADENHKIPAGGSVPSNHTAHSTANFTVTVSVLFTWPATGAQYRTKYVIDWGSAPPRDGGDNEPIPTTTTTTTPCGPGEQWNAPIGSPGYCSPAQPAPTDPYKDAPVVTNPEAATTTTVPTSDTVITPEVKPKTVVKKVGPAKAKPKTTAAPTADTLPHTGAESTVTALLGLAVVLIGGVLVLISHRSEETAS